MRNSALSESSSGSWSTALPPLAVSKIESIIRQKDRIARELKRVADESQGATRKRLMVTRRRLQRAVVLDDIVNDPDILAICCDFGKPDENVTSLDDEQVADAIRRGTETFRNHADSKQRLAPQLAYPYVLLVIAYGMCVLASFYIVNDIDKMYQEFGLDLPGISHVFFGLADSMRQWWVVGAVLLGLLGFWLFASSITTLHLPRWIRVLMIRNLGLRQAWSQWAWHTGWLLQLQVHAADAVLIAGSRSEERWLRENSRKWSARISAEDWNFQLRPRAPREPYGLLAHAFTLPTADDQAAVLHAYASIHRERTFDRHAWWLSWVPPLMMFFVILMIGLFLFAVYAPLFDLFQGLF